MMAGLTARVRKDDEASSQVRAKVIPVWVIIDYEKGLSNEEQGHTEPLGSGKPASSAPQEQPSFGIRSASPKKGKTRFPTHMVSRRALIDLGYTYIEEGNLVMVPKALGQENIAELLELSEEYKLSDENEQTARLAEERHEIYATPPPASDSMRAAPSSTGDGENATVKATEEAILGVGNSVIQIQDGGEIDISQLERLG
ncbi:hypothetical protein LZ30DRAFT_778089 [Colletotrichum cereale]|nr:hypothetical protein LZ30DRAFT_778089 [Colletotrichum cereale]